MKQSGVYKIYSIRTNRYYIGSSKNINNRFYRHLYDLRKNIHNNIHLQRIYNKYGETDLTIEIIEKCDPNRVSLLSAEQIYLDNKCDLCINMSSIAGSIEMTDIVRSKIGIKSRNRLKDKTKHPMYGRHHSDHTKQKLSLANKGKHKHTDEFKAKQRNRLLGKPRTGRSYVGVLNPNYGKTHSSETRQKISRNKPSSKGSNNPRYDPNIYTFIHIGGQIYTGTRFNFIKEFNLSPAGVCCMFKKRIKRHRGWSIHSHV
jgi:group I intron endonuclease